MKVGESLVSNCQLAGEFILPHPDHTLDRQVVEPAYFRVPLGEAVGLQFRVHIPSVPGYD